MKLMIAALTSLVLAQPGFAQSAKERASPSDGEHKSAEHFTLDELSTTRLDLRSFASAVDGAVSVTSSEESEAEIEPNEMEIGGPYYASEEDAWRDADLYATPDQ